MAGPVITPDVPLPPPGTGVLELRDVVKQFPTPKGTFTAVEDVNLATTPGEFLTFLGPSGCGKTTTLRMVAGFETPTSGQILLDGQDVGRLTPDKRPMSMVFQSYALFPHMTVYENVSYGLNLRRSPAGEKEKAVAAVLKSMDLEALADRAPNQLSGGQQQRVALARAMVMRPKVLLFDEPLSNLDAKLRVQMRTEIRRLQKKLGITAIYVTHDQDEAMALSDRIVVMNKGRVEQVGAPAEIYHRPASVFVADFIGSANFLDVDVASVDRPGQAGLTALGTARQVTSHPAVDRTGAATLLVRPESLDLTEPQPDAPRQCLGTIALTVYYGSDVEYEVDTAHGRLKAVVADPDPDHLFAEGQQVVVDFPDSRAWLLPSSNG